MSHQFATFARKYIIIKTNEEITVDRFTFGGKLIVDCFILVVFVFDESDKLLYFLFVTIFVFTCGDVAIFFDVEGELNSKRRRRKGVPLFAAFAFVFMADDSAEPDLRADDANLSGVTSFESVFMGYLLKIVGLFSSI